MTEIAMETSNQDNLNPWLSIWVKPKQTIRSVIGQKPGAALFVLAMLFGLSNVLDRAFMQDLGETMSVGAIFLVSLIIGPIAGILMWYISSAIVHFTGSKLGGQGTFGDVRKAIAYSYIPIVVTLLVWIPDYAVYGPQLFMEGKMASGAGGAIVSLLSTLFELAASVWAVVVTVAAVSEAHRFSIVKSVLTLLIPAAIFIIAAFIIAIAAAAIA